MGELCIIPRPIRGVQATQKIVGESGGLGKELLTGVVGVTAVSQRTIRTCTGIDACTQREEKGTESPTRTPRRSRDLQQRNNGPCKTDAAHPRGTSGRLQICTWVPKRPMPGGTGGSVGESRQSAVGQVVSVSYAASSRLLAVAYHCIRGDAQVAPTAGSCK